MQIFNLDIGLLSAGTAFRAQFEDRLRKLIEEIKQAGNVILVIDELHTLVSLEGGVAEASNILKPALARGDLQVMFLTGSKGKAYEVVFSDVTIPLGSYGSVSAQQRWTTTGSISRRIQHWIKSFSL